MSFQRTAGVAAVLAFTLWLLPSSPLGAAEKAAKCSGQSAEPLVKLLQPPPCETCEETKAELDELAGLESTRTKEQESAALNDAIGTVARFIEGAGIAVEAKALDACEGFFRDRRKEEAAAVEAAKSAFCRLRPFNTQGNGLHPVQGSKPETSFSYPSGHATWGSTLGLLLVRMLPEKRAELYARINSYARSRMVAGVHFRSDVEAGKLLGAALANAVLASPDFSREFDEARACVRKAVGLP